METFKITKVNAFTIAANSETASDEDKCTIYGVINRAIDKDIKAGNYSSIIKITKKEKEIFDKYRPEPEDMYSGYIYDDVRDE